MIKTDNFKQKLFWPQVPVQAISKQWKYNNLTSAFKDSPQMWYVRVESQKCECKSTNWEFNFTSYEFKFTSSLNQWKLNQTAWQTS